MYRTWEEIPFCEVNEMAHKREKPHECAVCGKKFAASANTMIHTEVKPHECTECGKQTRQFEKTHMIHTGEKLIECDVYIWEQICGVKQSEATRDDTYRREAS